MKINVSGRNLQITDHLRSIAEEKLSKFHRYFADDVVAHVKMQPQKEELRVELTLKFDQHVYRAEAVAAEATHAMQQVVDILEGQLRKHKAKIKKQRKKFEYLDSYMATVADEQPNIAEADVEITRRKTFELQPMDEEEAVLQMELLGHDFLLFLNTATDKVSLVYKRRAGDYGLLEPEY